MFASMLRKLSTLFGRPPKPPPLHPSPMEGQSLPWQDTLAAIADLKKMAEEKSGSFTIHLALGNLYRAQGDLDQAIAARSSLLHSPDLSASQKGRIFLELGRDYKRSGLLDRAEGMFQKAGEILGRDPVLLEEMASLVAAARNHEQAAALFAEVNKPNAQAHHMVQQAKTLAGKGELERSAWLLRKALKVSPGSIEAWMERMIQAYEAANWDHLSRYFTQGLSAVEPRLRFLLLEGLTQHMFTRRSPQELFSPVVPPEAGQTLVLVIEAHPPEVHLLYYGAWIQIQLGNYAQAKTHLQHCSQLDPEFWPARLELLALYAEEDQLSPICREHLEYILHRGRRVKKFVCSKCGLRLDQIFFQCPRCRSWHSIAFLKTLDS
ncbi:MAG: N-acetylglucosaminyl transferase [Desulfovermiculus sp.]|nr:N-acetylglucosaminyl transferase [Desulfovermiculus sp.]